MQILTELMPLNDIGFASDTSNSQNSCKITNSFN